MFLYRHLSTHCHEKKKYKQRRHENVLVLLFLSVEPVTPQRLAVCFFRRLAICFQHSNFVPSPSLAPLQPVSLQHRPKHIWRIREGLYEEKENGQREKRDQVGMAGGMRLSALREIKVRTETLNARKE